MDGRPGCDNLDGNIALETDTLTPDLGPFILNSPDGMLLQVPSEHLEATEHLWAIFLMESEGKIAAQEPTGTTTLNCRRSRAC